MATGARRPRIALLAAGVLAATSTLLAAGITGAVGAHAGTGVGQCSAFGVPDPVVPDRTPIIYVHGVEAGPSMWTDWQLALGKSFESAVIDGVYALEPGTTTQSHTFDWSSRSRDDIPWVSDDEVGKKLVKAIDCVAIESGHQVILVGHSMGGLISKFAADTARAQVAGVITIGSPLRGTPIVSLLGQGGRLEGLSIVVQQACWKVGLHRKGRAPTANVPPTAPPEIDATKPLCDFLGRLAQSRGSAGVLGMDGSLALTSKTGWPALPTWNGPHVLTIASDVQDAPLGALFPQLTVSLGDLVSPVASQHDDGAPGIQTSTVHCTVGPDRGVAVLLALPCVHTAETANRDIVTAVAQQIAALSPTAAAGGGGSQHGAPADPKNLAYQVACTDSSRHAVTLAGGKATASLSGGRRLDVQLDTATSGSLTGAGQVTAVLLGCSIQPSNWGAYEIHVIDSHGVAKPLADPPHPPGGPSIPPFIEQVSLRPPASIHAVGHFWGPGQAHVDAPAVVKDLTWLWDSASEAFVQQPISWPATGGGSVPRSPTPSPTPSPAPSPTPRATGAAPVTRQVRVSSLSGWQSAGIAVSAGQRVMITSITGSWTVDYRNFANVGPQGYAPADDAKIYQPCKTVASLPYAVLLAEIGGGSVLPVNGVLPTFIATTSGALQFRINDNCLTDNDGALTVTVSVA